MDMVRYLSAVAVACVATTLFAAEHKAAVSGNWSARQTWVNGIPADGDTVDIADGVTVTVADSRSIGSSGDNGTIAIYLN